jgi:hypothetical protein
MDLRNVLKKCFGILQLFSYCIAFFGYIQNKKAYKRYEKAENEGKTKEELLALIKEFTNVLMAGKKLVLVGIILGAIFGIISILI